MYESVLIKNVDLALPEGLKQGDILLKDGRICTFDWQLPAHADLIINGHGLTLLPGAIDCHVHLREPGMTDKEDLRSGSMAAAAGGITSFLEMPNTKPATTTHALLQQKKELASQKSLVNYNFFLGATPDNLSEILTAENIPGIKIFMGASTGDLLLEQTAALEKVFAASPHLIAVHAEAENLIRRNKERYQNQPGVATHSLIRSEEAALQACQTAIALAKKYQRRLHICHVSTRAEVELLTHEQAAWLSAEVTPHHLSCHTPEAYEKYGTLALVNPPLRTKEQGAALWQGLASGVINLIATDHAPHALADKMLPYGQAPSGVPGLETMLPLLLNEVNRGRISLAQLTHWIAEQPAHVFRLANRGRIALGYAADLVAVDLRKTKKVDSSKFYSKAKWSLFDGQSLQGWPLITFVNGQPVYREGDFMPSIASQELEISTGENSPHASRLV